MPKQIINIDASSLSQSSCLLSWYRTVHLGYREKATSSAIVYGQAVHKYIDTMFKTKGDLKKSREEMQKTFNRPKINNSKKEHLSSFDHCYIVAYNLWEDFVSKDSNYQVLLLPHGEPATECTFSFPFIETESTVVNLCGTIDTIGKIKDGIFCIRDFKTTSVWDVRSYLEGYAMSAQLRFYALALRLMHERHPDSVLGQVGAGTVGARIDAIFIKPAAAEVKYISSNVFTFKQETVEEFRTMLTGQIHRLLDWIEKNELPPREGILNGTCQKIYGPCKYSNICQAPAEVREVMLDRDFIKKPYDPLTFGEA